MTVEDLLIAVRAVGRMRSPTVNSPYIHGLNQEMLKLWEELGSADKLEIHSVFSTDRDGKIISIKRQR